MMKSFEVKFVDRDGNIYVQRLCCRDLALSHVIRAAWKSLHEGKGVAATALVDSIHEVDAI